MTERKEIKAQKGDEFSKPPVPPPSTVEGDASGTLNVCGTIYADHSSPSERDIRQSPRPSNDIAEELKYHAAKDQEHDPDATGWTMVPPELLLRAATALQHLSEARDECERQFQEQVAEVGRLVDSEIQLTEAQEELERVRKACDIAEIHERELREIHKDDRAIIARSRAERNAAVEDNRRQSKEIERLREALNWIADIDPRTHINPIDDAMVIARAALQPKGTE